MAEREEKECGQNSRCRSYGDLAKDFVWNVIGTSIGFGISLAVVRLLVGHPICF